MRNFLSLFVSLCCIIAFTSCGSTPPAYPLSSDNQLISVMNNEKPFIAENGKEIYLNDFLYAKDDIAEYYAEPHSYAFVDFDADGTNELVVDISQNGTHYLILRTGASSIYGYTFERRSLQSIKSDGTFTQTGGADCNYLCKIVFNSTAYTITYIAVADEVINRFEINGKECTQAEANDYINNWSFKENIDWINT